MDRVHHRLLLLVWIAWTIPASAQQQAGRQATSSLPPVDSSFPFELRPAETLLPHDSADVPLDMRGGRPTVMIMINGHGPFRFGVETGAPLITLHATVAEAIGYATADHSQWAVLDSVNIGAATFRVVHAKILSVPVSNNIQDLDGLLGLNLYYDVLLTLDPARQRMRLTRGALPPMNHHDVLALEPIGTQWYGMESWVNGASGVAFLDTQFPDAFMVTPSQVADSQFVTAPVAVSTMSGPSLGAQTILQGRLNGDIRVGNVTFQHPVVKILSIPSPLMQRWIIGWETLRHFTITLDQRQRRIRLTSSESLIPPSQ